MIRTDDETVEIIKKKWPFKASEALMKYPLAKHMHYKELILKGNRNRSTRENELEYDGRKSHRPHLFFIFLGRFRGISLKVFCDELVQSLAALDDLLFR